MNREEKIADLVQRWIPDELRLDTRHDAKLVSSAITTVIMAVYDSDRMTMKSQSSDVNAALKTWFDTTFTEHMRAEDDHMQGLEEKASRAMPVVSNISYEKLDESEFAFGEYTFDDSRFPGVKREALVWTSNPSVDAVTYTVRVKRDSSFVGSGDTPSSAFRQAVINSGAMVKGDIP